MEEKINSENELQYNSEQKHNHVFDQPDNASDLTGLAGRGTRLAAVFIDSFILFIPYLIVNILFSGFNGYMENLRNLSFEFIVGSLFLGIISNLSINGYLLYKKGQTIGKMSMDIKIVDMNNNVPSLFHSFFLRSFLFSVVYFIPYAKIIVLLDPLFIFSKNRRCLHDRLAGTKVVDVEIIGD